ncbi:hypothetical protein BJ508DRAFT_85179 [Ascobolus immersus RN42]|uniref:CBM1 domain-containing protein n=1 Tax=Ascobolus immersus RN42 TaxID=1160509 RepID=A0A3N4HIH3_ASCIM|nr:hypothetical protein BJ508DRAFT_85179 [Ascobolus immersus RN42]
MKFALTTGIVLGLLSSCSIATPLVERHHDDDRWCKASTKTIVRTSWIPKTTTTKTRTIHTTKTWCPKKDNHWNWWDKTVTKTSTVSRTKTNTITTTSVSSTTKIITPDAKTITSTLQPEPETKYVTVTEPVSTTTTITSTVDAEPTTAVVTVTSTASPSTVTVTVTSTTESTSAPSPTPTIEPPSCTPDGGQCSLFDPGACCGQACRNAQPFPTCFSFT